MLATLLLAWASQGPCPLVVDLNTTPTPHSGVHHSIPVDLAHAPGGELPFAGNDPLLGFEPYFTDGTAAGTRLLLDINPNGNSAPGNFLAWNGLVYFTADDGVHGREVWRTDGTAAGTFMLGDLNGGSSNNPPKLLLGMGNQVFFKMKTSTHGEELWRTDGTVAGTSVLKDIYPGVGSGNPTVVVKNAAGNRLYFAATNLGFGYEPWISDGTTAGTVLLKDTYAGALGGQNGGSGFVEGGGVMWFTTNHPVNGLELWKSDGTTAGTVKALDAVTGNTIPVFASGVWWNGHLYFSQFDPATGYELWRNDMQSETSELVFDAAPGAQSGFPSVPFEFGGELYFVARSYASSTPDWTVFATGGTPASTRVVVQFAGTGTDQDPENFVVVGGRIHFDAYTAGSGREPWVSDGTPAGTFMLADLAAGEGSSVSRAGSVAGNEVWFQAATQSVGNELFKSDGTAAWTGLLVDVDPVVETESGMPVGLARSASGELYYRRQGLPFNGEPYRYDPTTGVESSLGDLDTTWSFGSRARDFTEVVLGGQPRMMFDADVGGVGREVFVSDGTPAGTTMLSPASPQELDNFESFVFEQVGDRVLFGEEFPYWWLTRTDGTLAGTARLHSPSGSELMLDTAATLCSGGEFAIFSGREALSPFQSGVWSTDGTDAGTQLLQGTQPGEVNRLVSALRVGSRVVFLAQPNDSNSTRKLLITDGTLAGTTELATISSFQETNVPDLFAFGGGVAWWMREGSEGAALWFSDLTPGGTFKWVDPDPGPNGIEVNAAVVAGDRMFFEGRLTSDPSLGFELWVTDGTLAGTQLVQELVPGNNGVHLRELVAVGERVFFGSDPTAPAESPLYVSDGTTITTACTNGAEVLWTEGLEVLGGDLYFTARGSGLEGYELFVLPNAGASVDDLGLGGLQLKASTPLLGSSVQAHLLGAPAGNVQVLGISPPTTAVSAAQGFVPHHALWLDPSATTLWGFSLSTAPVWSAALPNTPSLAGLVLRAQAASIDPSFAAPIALSNGLELVLGF